MIVTKRLLLRRFMIEDSESFFQLIIDKEASAYAVYDEPFPTDEQSMKEILAYFSASDEFYAICAKESGELIGFVTLNKTEAERIRNLGFCIRADYQKKGYGREATEAVMEYAFTQLEIDKLISGTANDNLPACKLLKALGFIKTDEKIGSFRKDKKGNPIEFVGGTYERIHGTKGKRT